MNDIVSKRVLLREKDNRWCEARVELRQREKGLELSITGSEGQIVSRKDALKMAIEYWVSFFDEQPEERRSMNERFNWNCRTSKGAALKVVQHDGEFHGLDVHFEDRTDGRVYLTESCGQIVEEINSWFPELIPLLPFHLNGMKAGCKHQRDLGWGHKKTVALSPDDLTEPQREALDALALAATVKPRAEEFNRRQSGILASDAQAVAFAKRFKKTDQISLSDMDQIRLALKYKEGFNGLQHFLLNKTQKEMWNFLKHDVEQDIKPKPFTGALYQNCLSAPCPVCGYLYGSAWVHDELPAEIVEAAKAFGK